MKKLFMLLSLAAITSFSSQAQTVTIVPDAGLCGNLDVYFYISDYGTCSLGDRSIKFTVTPGTPTVVSLTNPANWANGVLPTGTYGVDWEVERVGVQNSLTPTTTTGVTCTNPMNLYWADQNKCLSTYPNPSCSEYSATSGGCAAGTTFNFSIDPLIGNNQNINIWP